MSDAGARAVLIGAGSSLGQEIRRQLCTRRFPMRNMTMMGSGEEIGQVVEFDGEARMVVEMDPDHLESADLLFLAQPGTAAQAALEVFRRGHGVAIDLVGVAASSDPVINIEVNPEVIPATRPASIRVPHSLVLALTTALHALAGSSRVVRLAAVVLIPASEFGQDGVNELYKQTAAVLEFATQPQDFFKRQVAFNAVPHALMEKEHGWPGLDDRLARETAHILGLASGEPRFRSILVPVFHGTSMLLTVYLDPPVPVRQRRTRLTRGRFGAGPMTPADLRKSTAIHVTDLGEDAAGGLCLWLVADLLRCSAAENGVRIAEALNPVTR